MTLEPVNIQSGDHIVSGILTVPEKAGTEGIPFVVLSHGLLSSKQSAKYVMLAEVLCKHGIASCRFDYHGCGESGGRIEETTLTLRSADLNAVVDFIVGRYRSARIGLLGSSFGGSTSLLQAARDQRITCTSLWATPYKVEKEEGGNTLDGIVFHDTLFSDFACHDLLAEAERVSKALVIHGSNDETVSVKEGKAIYERIREPKKLAIIPGADHTFSEPQHRDRAIKLAVDWFASYLL